MSPKKSLLVSCKTFKEFVNTLIADDKYSLLNRDKLMEPIQRQLSLKKKPFSPFFFFFAISKSTLNFKHFQEKDDPHS